MQQPTEKDKIESRRKFARAFNSTMMRIWKERIVLLDVWNEGVLFKSLHINTGDWNDDVSELTFGQDFRTYGLWQNYGVGKETPRGNPGDIGRPKVRKPRPWFDRKFFASTMNLRDFLCESFAQQYLAMFSDAFSDRKLRQQATVNNP